MIRNRQESRPFRSPRRAGGFTLVEILVVIGIIIVLMGILIPLLSKARVKAAIAAQKLDFVTIGAALESYKSDFHVYPSNSGFTLNGTVDGMGPLAAGLLGPGAAASVVVNGNTELGDGADGPGFRTIGRKIWGPYLPVDKFSIVWLPQKSGGMYAPFILDHWGNPIEYFPEYNPPNIAVNVIGSACAQGAAPAGDMFDYRDSVVLVNPNPSIPTGQLDAFLVKLGDVAQVNTLANFAANGETLAPFGPYLLISAGPDGVFCDLSKNTSGLTPGAYVIKSDDVYNFEN